MAESVIGLYKSEVIRNQGPWRHIEAVEFATHERADRWNNRRILQPIGDIPPFEKEATYHHQHTPAHHSRTHVNESPANPDRFNASTTPLPELPRTNR
jgi:transposase InsO family protein